MLAHRYGYRKLSRRRRTTRCFVSFQNYVKLIVGYYGSPRAPIPLYSGCSPFLAYYPSPFWQTVKLLSTRPRLGM